MLVPTAAVLIVDVGVPHASGCWPFSIRRGTRSAPASSSNQSLIAVGSGGAFGKGLMAGVQKLFYIPEPHTDFIFAVIGEELGLIGTTVILICVCSSIAWRGLRAALLAPDRFGALLALGITMMVALPGARQHQRRHRACCRPRAFRCRS